MTRLPLTLRQYFANINLSKKLTLSFLVVAVIPLLIVFIIAYYNSSIAIKSQVYNQLSAISSIKKSGLERYFKQVELKLVTTALSPTTKSAAIEFQRAFAEVNTNNNAKPALKNYYDTVFFDEFKKTNPNVQQLNINFDALSTTAVALQTRYILDNANPIGSKQQLLTSGIGDSYDNVHSRYHNYFTNLTEYYEFYDLFIVDNRTGNIIYSVYKELDFATSLLDGPYANSNIASVFKKSQSIKTGNNVAFIDYQPYFPSYNNPASFIAMPIDRDTTLIFSFRLMH